MPAEPCLTRREITALNSRTVERYARRMAEKGPGAYALGWGRRRFQIKRFEDLLHALEPEDIQGRSVLDIGCGFGDLYAFFKQCGLAPAKYVGLDINPGFVEVARRRHPECRFELRDLVLDPFPSPIADLGVLLGVMNFKIGHQMRYAREMIRRSFGSVRAALAVNVISDIHNENYPREPLIHYYRPHEMLRFAQTLTPFCSLVHDYRGAPQHEFMLVMRKLPWRPKGKRRD